ncbi:MAG: ABC transporter substrate-binding protein, partial [Myxococcales bacterium]|nr:ABC transporter substrate-binding protein [Myxococcales bacterium]
MPGRASWIVGPVVALLLASACRTNKPADPDTRTEVAITPVSPGHVDPKFESAWQKVREASERDPASPAVVAAADSLLSQDPPLNLRIAAIHAKVAHAYLNRMDPAAIQMADQAIAAASGQPLDGGEGMVDDLARLRALARARGGDPGLALQELRGLLERGRIAEREWIAASAIAYGRAGAQGEAALAHARWRERVADRSPEAEYCDRRLSELLRGLDRQTLETLARRVSGTDAALCLLASAGHPLPGDVAAWVTRCRPRSAAIGVLLPRTGRFAGLADPQLAAATAAVRVLSRHQGSGVSVLWEDSGSTAEQTREATRQILAEGVEVIVGPVG